MHEHSEGFGTVQVSLKAAKPSQFDCASKRQAQFLAPTAKTAQPTKVGSHADSSFNGRNWQNSYHRPSVPGV